MYLFIVVYFDYIDLDCIISKVVTCYFFSDLLVFLNIFLNQQERQHYEYIVCEGKIIHKQSGDFLHTHEDSEAAKWIFVMSTSKKLYAGKVTTIQAQLSVRSFQVSHKYAFILPFPSDLTDTLQ